MLFSGKIPFHVAARLTPRFWVPHLLRFATIRHYSRLFAIIRTIRDYSHYSRLFALFATIRTIRDYSHYSPLFALFETIRTIRHYSHYSRLFALFAVRYSRLFAIRYSGFPDTPPATVAGMDAPTLPGLNLK